MFIALVALIVGFLGALHAVRHIRVTTRSRFYKGTCSLPLPRSYSMVTGRFENPDVEEDDEDAVEPLTPVIKDRLTVTEFDYELDLDLEEIEEFALPELSRGRYLHDFTVNKTAIVDADGGRCFITTLDRDQFPRPKSLFDILVSLQEGNFELDIDELRVETRVELPPLANPLGEARYGHFIPAICEDYVNYVLVDADKVQTKIVTEEEIRILSKRSVGRRGDFDFAEFSGKNIIEYKILNLNEAPGRVN